MDKGLRVDPGALGRDGRVFADWSGELDAIRAAIPADLSVADFSDLPGASGLRDGFQDLLSNLESYVAAGSREFGGVARNLLETARDYLATEEGAEAEFQRLSREVNDL